MNRREVLKFVASTGLLAVGATAAAAEPPTGGAHDAMPMAGMHHHDATASPYADLATASSHCVSTGDACLSHCLTLLGQGDKELAACAKTVRDTIAACTALRELAAADSPHVKELAKVVSGICGDCEAECKKHEKHSVCKDCEKACHDCREICDKVAATS